MRRSAFEKSALSFVALLVACDNDSIRTPIAQEAAVEAAQSLEDDAANAGLTARDFKVDSTLPEIVVALDDLGQSKEKARLNQTGRQLYLMAAGNYRAAIYLRQKQGKWIASQIYGQKLAAVVSDQLQRVRATHQADDNAFMLVDIAGMHLKLLGHREKGALMLTPLHERPDLGLHAGEVLPAAQLLPMLAPASERWIVNARRFQ